MSPEVERLASHLGRAPAVFLGPVDPGAPGAPRVEAVLADLVRARATRPLTADEIAWLAGHAATAPGRRRLSLWLITSWLLHDRAFTGVPTERVLSLLAVRLSRLAEHVTPSAFAEDAERREELVRTCLAELGRTPPGETEAEATDRLASLDSVLRRELLQAARAREEERAKRKAELERLRQQEEEERRQAARTTFED